MTFLKFYDVTFPISQKNTTSIIDSATDTIIIIFSLCEVFHTSFKCSLNDFKSPRVFRTLLNILVDLNSTLF